MGSGSGAALSLLGIHGAFTQGYVRKHRERSPTGGRCDPVCPAATWQHLYLQVTLLCHVTCRGWGVTRCRGAAGCKREVLAGLARACHSH